MEHGRVNRQPAPTARLASLFSSLRETLQTYPIIWKAIVWYLTALVLHQIGGDYGAHMLWIIGTMFYGMLTNLGRRAPGTLSAWSVFNENFESIEGSLSASDLDRQLRNGPTVAELDEQVPEQQHARENVDDIDEAMLQMAIAQSLEESKKEIRGGKKKRRKQAS